MPEFPMMSLTSRLALGVQLGECGILGVAQHLVVVEEGGLGFGVVAA